METGRNHPRSLLRLPRSISFFVNFMCLYLLIIYILILRNRFLMALGKSSFTLDFLLLSVLFSHLRPPHVHYHFRINMVLTSFIVGYVFIGFVSSKIDFVMSFVNSDSRFCFSSIPFTNASFPSLFHSFNYINIYYFRHSISILSPVLLTFRWFHCDTSKFSSLLEFAFVASRLHFISISVFF